MSAAASETVQLIRSGMDPSEATGVDRDDAIVLIREALRQRSGKPWSVTGGRGTGWGWIRIMSPPARRVGYEGVRLGDGHDWYMSEADRVELGELLGLRDPCHNQGESIPASSDYRREYIARARGLQPLSRGIPYWD